MPNKIQHLLLFTTAIFSLASSFAAERQITDKDAPGVSHPKFQPTGYSPLTHQSEEDSAPESLLSVLRNVSLGSPQATVPPLSSSLQQSPGPQTPPLQTSASMGSLEAAGDQTIRGTSPQLPATPDRLTPSPKPPSSPGPHAFRDSSYLLQSLMRSPSTNDLSPSSSVISLSTTLPYPSARSFFLFCDTKALTQEYIQKPTAPIYLKQRDIKLVYKVPFSLRPWFYETQALWTEYKAAKDRKTLKEKMLKEIQDDVSVDPLLQADASPQSQPKAQQGLLSTLSIVNLRAQQTPAQKLAYRETRAEEARRDFQKILAKVKARHPALTDEQIETLAYKPPLSLTEQKSVERESVPSARAFEITSEIDLIRELRMLEGSTDLNSSPGRIVRMESFIKALIDVQTAYQRDIVGRTQGWSADKIKEWWNLKGEDGPQATVINQLREKYVFVSPARLLGNDHNTYKGFALRVLNLDPLGDALTKTYFRHVKKFKDPLLEVQDEEAQARSQKALRTLNARYRELPKHFDEKGNVVALEVVIEPINDLLLPSVFQRAYEGLDKKVTTNYAKSNILVSTYTISDRLYKSNDDKAVLFVPASSDLLAKDPKIITEYSGVMRSLEFEVDKPAEEKNAVLQPNPLVKKFADMPKKFARMVRDFPTFQSLGYHRERWIEVLRDLHKKRRPILAGYGEGLFKPIEDSPELRGLFKPMEDSSELRLPLNPELVSRHTNACKKYKEQLETIRDRFKELTVSPGMFSYLPYACEFICFTMPERPTQQLPAELTDTQFSRYGIVLILNNRGVTDSHLEATYRTPSGAKKGLFSGCTELDLTGNELTNPKAGLDFGQLQSLRVSHNNLTSLEFINHLWGQLKECQASHNKLDKVPSCKEGVNPLLTDLDLASNSILSLEGIAQFQQLKTLDISGNVVKTLQSLASLQFLESVTANSCGLSGKWNEILPPLKSLRVISVKSNKNLLFLLYMQKTPYTSADRDRNDMNFNQAFPSLEVFVATLNDVNKELKAEVELSNSSGAVSRKIIAPIKISNLSPFL